MTPDPKKFIDSYKHILVSTCITLSRNSNCEADSSSTLLDLLNVPVQNSTPSDAEVLEIGDDIPDEDLEVPSSAESNVLLYVAGYAGFQYLKSHNCSSCQNLLLGSLATH